MIKYGRWALLLWGSQFRKEQKGFIVFLFPLQASGKAVSTLKKKKKSIKFCKSSRLGELRHEAGGFLGKHMDRLWLFSLRLGPRILRAHVYSMSSFWAFRDWGESYTTSPQWQGELLFIAVNQYKSLQWKDTILTPLDLYFSCFIHHPPRDSEIMKSGFSPAI